VKRLILISAIFFLSACTTTQYVTVPLDVPVRPTYATVTSDELMCMTTDAYTRLAISIKQRNTTN